MSSNQQDGATVLITVDIRSKSPDTATVADKIGVKKTAIDQNYGVVLIDPVRKRYAVKVDAIAFERRTRKHADISGPYSDPPIGTMRK